MESITLNQTQGRGRNGWFQAREASLLATPDRIDLDVTSSRPVIPGPVRLEMSPQDALALSRALLRAVAEAQPVLLSQEEAHAGAFSDPQAAIAAMDAFVQMLAASPWIRTGELEAIRTETVALKELLALSGSGR